jgi:hypothetical protein
MAHLWQVNHSVLHRVPTERAFVGYAYCVDGVTLDNVDEVLRLRPVGLGVYDRVYTVVEGLP